MWLKMSKASRTVPKAEPSTHATESVEPPPGPYDAPPGVVMIKVLRREIVDGDARWVACLRYDSETASLVPYHPVPDEPISEFILDRWGSGTYHPCWFGPGSKAMGRGKTLELQDARRPRGPLQFGAPPGIAPGSSTPASSSSSPPGIAELLALLTNPQVAPLLTQLQGQPASQLELARIERERERERREWEERRERERREWEDERARARAADERRAERERQEEADKRRRDEEDHRARLLAERRRHEEELRNARENSGGVTPDDLEDMYERLKTELTAEMQRREKGMLEQIMDVVKMIAPAVLPQIQAAMGAARPRPIPQVITSAPIASPPAAPPATGT